MPLTVLELFDFEELNKHRLQEEDNPVIVENLKQLVQGPVEWGDDELANSSGAYVVSLSDNPNENNNCEELIPVCETTVKNVWLKNAQYMTIDGQEANIKNIKSFLSEFWLPKESILYIGQTKRELRVRVREYYRHQIGKNSPHSGGQWLHALSICSKTFVYYVETDNYKQVEKYLLQNFDFHVRKAGNNNERVLPFANLRMKTKNGNYDKNIRMNQQNQ